MIQDATHIFDGMNSFPTHICHMRFGEIVNSPVLWTPNGAIQSSPSETGSVSALGSSLHALALQWLKEDREYRRELERNGRKTRGARRDEVVPTDSETFFRKYVPLFWDMARNIRYGILTPCFLFLFLKLKQI